MENTKMIQPAVNFAAAAEPVRIVPQNELDARAWQATADQLNANGVKVIVLPVPAGQPRLGAWSH